MELSGLILDVYDDLKGDVLRSLYPSQDNMPDFIKSAQLLSSEDRQNLPDDVFALVLQNDDQVLRKFACIDEGNTTLSVQYFLKNAHKLPVEAQKIAAANLIQACSWYDITVPEPLAKIADVTGTCDMPYQSPTSSAIGKEKAVVKKAATMGHLVSGHKNEHGDFGPIETEHYDGYTKGKTPEKLPQSRQLKPHCDVTTKCASAVEQEREVSRWALPSEEKYPLDDYTQIKTASNYFAEYHSQFSPEKKHEFAMNLVKRANEVGLIVSDVARRYGNTSYADHEDIKVAYELRDKACAWDDTAREMLHELFEKRAELHPEVFARALGEFDKTAGIAHLYGSHIPDNFFSTFGGFEKVANEMDVDELLLRKLAHKFPSELQEKFASDFCEEFRRDPVGIFQSMPSDQQQLLLKMASKAA